MTPSRWRRAIVDRPRAGWTAPLVAIALSLSLGLASAAPSRADDSVLKLVPADAGLILSIDDAREHAREILKTNIVQEFRRLPAVEAWRKSPKVQKSIESREKIEEFLEASFQQIGDEIFGDSVALALIAPTDSPRDARGLLVLQARDPELLKRLIDKIDAEQKKKGEVTESAEHKRGEITYVTRKFRDDLRRPDETFATFPDGTFALSNSKDLIEWVIDRKAKPEGDSAADLPELQTVADRLPKNAAARVFVSADLARRVAAKLPTDDKPESKKALEIIRAYADALQYAGGALTIEDSTVAIRTAQSFEPEKLRKLAGWFVAPSSPDRDGPGPRLDSVPASTLALASVNFDVAGLYGALASFVPENDRPKLEKLEILAKGVLLGQDLRSKVLAALGPRSIAYVGAPTGDAAERGPKGSPFPLVIATEIREPAGGGDEAPSVAAAIDNALRFLLTALSLDQKRVPPGSRVETRDGVTALNVPYPFAFAVDRPGRRVAIGSSAAAVARYLEADVDPDAGARFRQLRDAAFADYGSFGCVDLAAVADLAAKNKDRLVAHAVKRHNRPAEKVAKDFDQALALVRLFDAAFAACRTNDDGALVEHSFGLVPRPSEKKAEVETEE